MVAVGKSGLKVESVLLLLLVEPWLENHLDKLFWQPCHKVKGLHMNSAVCQGKFFLPCWKWSGPQIKEQCSQGCKSRSSSFLRCSPATLPNQALQVQQLLLTFSMINGKLRSGADQLLSAVQPVTEVCADVSSVNCYGQLLLPDPYRP